MESGGPRQRSVTTFCEHLGKTSGCHRVWGPQPWAHGSGLGSEPQRRGGAVRPGAQPQDPESSGRGCPPQPVETRPQPVERPARRPPPPSEPGSAARESPDCGNLQNLRFPKLFGVASPGGESTGPGLRCSRVTRGPGHDADALGESWRPWSQRLGSGHSVPGCGVVGACEAPRQRAPFLPSPSPPGMFLEIWGRKGQRPLLSPHWVSLSQLHRS